MKCSKSMFYNGNRKLVYEYLVFYYKKNKCCPSLNDIKNALGISSKSNVGIVLKQLEKMGLITYVKDANGKNIQLVGYKFVRDHDVKVTVMLPNGCQIAI